MQGFTDYTLAKRAVLAMLRSGGLSPLDVCDAHPELLRAAKNIGLSAQRPCPVCSHDTLRTVSYVYGDALKELSGRPVYPQGWDLEISERFDEFRCYQVEVCLDCSWNHLTACYLMGRNYGPVRARAQRRSRK